MSSRPTWTLLRLRDAARPDRAVVVRARSDAVVADVAALLGIVGEGPPFVDGRPVRSTDGLDEAGLCQGSLLSSAFPATPPTGSSTGESPPTGESPAVCGESPAIRRERTVTITICDGGDAGRRFALAPGEHLVGRSPAAAVHVDDPEVALLHGVLCVEPSATGGATFLAFGDAAPDHPIDYRTVAGATARPLRAGERFRCGSVTLRLDGPEGVPGAVPSRVDPRRDRTERATILFNRPPRARHPVAEQPVPVPYLPEMPPVRPLALAAVALPLVLAGALVAVTGSWLFALMTVLSPLLAVSGWLGSRRQARRTGRRHRRRFRRELAGFEAALVDARAAHDAARADRAVDLAEVASRAQRPSRRLWERRPGDGDAWRVCLGHGLQRWQPTPAPPAQELGAAVRAVLREVGGPLDGPVELDLGAIGVIGLVGDPAAARRVARSLMLQLVVHHGPADLAVELFAGEGRRDAWRWLGWLPHHGPSGGGRPAGPDGSGTAGGPGGPGGPDRWTGRRTLLVVDDPRIVGAAGADARAQLRGERGPTFGVVLAPVADQLPASCRVVVRVDAVGAATVTPLDSGEPMPAVRAMGASQHTAYDIAASLARFEDPDLARPDAGLPAVVHLDDVLPTGCRWAHEGTPTVAHAPSGLATLAVPIGLGERSAGRGAPLERSALMVDLVADGPHALVAGTTGAGKSELLRSWIAALAATYPPTELNVVLIDFKGGSAFDACAALPHTVAVVTDLDDDLAARVLRSLHAELARREQVLRDAGAADVAELAAGAAPAGGPVDGPGAGPVDGPPSGPPLARLVVVIDEFATLKTELPEFLDALVGVAQRGRSLGVHLILATQRPSGVVSDQIRANTNLRIALRVQDPADSRDVIELPDAAALDRRTPGRALVRLGRHDVTIAQTAYAGSVRETGESAGSPVERLEADLLTPPDGWASEHGTAVTPRRSDPGQASELQGRVEQVAAAARRLGLAAARVPWTPPLPARLGFAELQAERVAAPQTGPTVPFVLLDDPDHQRRLVGGWCPSQGNLLLYGAIGQGTTTALVTLLCALAGRAAPHRLHLHIVSEAPELTALAALPQVGTVVGRSDTERLGGLLCLLEAELADRRRGVAGPGVERPMVVVAVDGLGSLLAVEDGGAPVHDAAQRWSRLIVEGPAQQLYTVASAEHAAAVRHSVAASVGQRFVFALADPLDARQFGVPTVTGPAGRVRAVPGGLLGQVAEIEDVAAVLRAQTERYGNGGRGAAPSVRCLPDRIERTEIGRVRVDEMGGTLTIPIGVGGPGLGERVLTLRRGDGVLVAGPVRSGRSSALHAIVAGLLDQPATPAGRVAVVVVAGSRSPLAAGRLAATGAAAPDRFDPAQHDAWAARLAAGPPVGGWGIVAVDDAESLEDRSGALGAALSAGWIVVAAGRNDALRSAYGHWTRAVRTSRIGLLLRPDPDLDGELLGARLPRRGDVPLDRPGRGFLVQDGSVGVLQVATANHDV
ncbi:MAG: hypothetical protein IT196_11850 [Acidimicrobiales bacterium]|nr:hypothetical protein [Acidimicrobiales bacterium]